MDRLAVPTRGYEAFQPKRRKLLQNGRASFSTSISRSSTGGRVHAYVGDEVIVG
jgi:hypothetical protein